MLFGIFRGFDNWPREAWTLTAADAVVTVQVSHMTETGGKSSNKALICCIDGDLTSCHSYFGHSSYQ